MLLVVATCAPDPTAPDPADRLLGRLVAGLADRGPVRVAAGEVTDEAATALSSAGVEVVRLVDPADQLATGTRLGRPTAVVVTDPGSPASVAAARAVDGAGPLGGLPLVVLVAESLRSAEAAAMTGRPGAHHLDGLDQYVEALAAAERCVLATAAAVCCGSATAAEQVAAVAGAGRPTPQVLGRPLRWSPSPHHPAERRGLAVPGRWHGEPGLADEEGLRALADELLARCTDLAAVGPIHPVGLDGPAVALAAVRRLSAPRAERRRELSWTEALAWSTTVALPRRFGVPRPLVVDDVVTAGVPLVVHRATVEPADLGTLDELVVVDDVDAMVDRAVELARHRPAWTEAHDALEAVARHRADEPDPVAQLAEVLTGLGVTLGPTPRAGAGADARWTIRDVRRPAGTVAAASVAAERHERLLGLGWSGDRNEGMRAQSLVDVDRRHAWWCAVHEETPQELERMRRQPPPFAWQPTVSVLVPCFRTPLPLLEAMVASVRAQVYGRWQLCLVDDASGDDVLTARLDDLAADDDRIVVAHLPTNRGIAGATDAALGLAEGELVALLDHDDELHPAALWRVVERWNLEPDLDLVYTDEDKLDEQGRRVEPHHKPDWNPDLLLGLNYVNHLTVVRRSLVEQVGGWRPGFDGAQDLDLVLRLTEVTDRVGHVARPLYHWRKVAGSTAADAAEKGGAGPAGRRAVAEAITRRGGRAEIVPGELPTWHHVRWQHDHRPLVSIVLPTRDRGELVRRCLDSVTATTEHPWELVLVDNGSTDPDSLAYFAELDAGGATVVRYPHDFHFARQVNLGIEAARGPLVLVLNNDTVVRSPGWLEEMVGQGLRPEVGAVGVRLLRDEHVAQHEGIVIGVGGMAWNLDSGPHREWGGVVRDCSAVTAAAVLCRTSVLRAVGGFDDSLRVALNDVDLCLRISALGWRVVYTPFAELTHAESASRGTLHPMEDEEHYVGRWGPERSLRDPLWNVNLDMINADNLVL